VFQKHIYTHTHLHIHKYINTTIQEYMNSYIRVFQKHVYIHTHLHIRILRFHTHTYTHTHISADATERGCGAMLRMVVWPCGVNI